MSWRYSRYFYKLEEVEKVNYKYKRIDLVEWTAPLFQNQPLEDEKIIHIFH